MRTQLREHRKAHGLTADRLAEVLGVTPRTVKKWQSGDAWPQPRHVKKLETLFGKPVSVLLAPANENGLSAHGNAEANGDGVNVYVQE